MKKLMLFIFTLFLLSGCIDTTPEDGQINHLEHATILQADSLPGDTMVIVTQSYKDYVFIKKQDKLVLYKVYISSNEFMDLPGIALFGIIITIFFIGCAIGSISNES